MLKEISEKQFWETYKSLPEELQEAIFSEKTAEIIFNICTDNEIEDLRISKIAKCVGRTLLGFLPPEQLQPTLELDLDIDSKAAENICQAIYSSILEPVRAQLTKLYLTSNKRKESSLEEGASSSVKKQTEKKEEISPAGGAKEKEKSFDSYRESIN